MNKKVEGDFEKIKTQFDDEFYTKAKANFKAQIEKLDKDKGTLKFNFSEFFNSFEKELDKKFPKVIVDRFMLDLTFRIIDFVEISKIIIGDFIKDGLIFDGHARYQDEGTELMFVIEVVPMMSAKKRYDA